MSPRIYVPSRHDIAVARRVVDVADTRHRIVRTDHLHACGASKDWIHWQLGRGWMARQQRGVFLIGGRTPTLQGRWVVATDAMGPSSMLIGMSAAVCWDLVDDWRLTAIDDVYVPSNRRSRPGIRARQLGWMRDLEPARLDGVTIAPRAAAFITLAPLLPVPHLIRALERGQFRDPSLPDTVRRLLDDAPSLQGASRIDEALELFRLGDHGVASGFEFDIDAELERLGASPALRNVVLRLPDGGLLRVDRYWPDARLILEADHDQHQFERNVSIDLGRDARALLANLETVRIPRWLSRSDRTLALMAVATRAREHRIGPAIEVVSHG